MSNELNEQNRCGCCDGRSERCKLPTFHSGECEFDDETPGWLVMLFIAAGLLVSVALFAYGYWLGEIR